MSVIAGLISNVLGVGNKYLDTRQKRDEFERDIKNALSEVNLAQIGVNLEEAKSQSLFKSGWRPFAGWISVTALGLNMIVFPLMNFAGLPAPELDMEMVIYILGGLLGMGTLRTVDKRNGKA